MAASVSASSAESALIASAWSSGTLMPALRKVSTLDMYASLLDCDRTIVARPLPFVAPALTGGPGGAAARLPAAGRCGWPPRRGPGRFGRCLDDVDDGLELDAHADRHPRRRDGDA